MDKFVKKTQGQLKRHRPFTIAAIFSCAVVIILSLSYFIFVQLIIKPLAHDAFRGRLGSVYYSSTSNDPTTKAQWVIGAESTSELADHYIDYASLPMRRPEADVLVSYLRPTDVYLEFGGSTTTLSFPHLVKKTFVIEYRDRVCSEIDHILKSDLGKDLRITLLCVKASSQSKSWAKENLMEDEEYRFFEEYVDAPRRIDMSPNDSLFDRVLLHGPAKVACALRILPYLRPDSLVFFHNFFLHPSWNHPVLNFYDEVARVLEYGPKDDLDSNTPSGLLVLKPKKDVLTGASEIFKSRVDAIYRNMSIARKADSQQSRIESPWSYVNRTEAGGMDISSWKEDLVYQLSKRRVALDIIALLGALLTSKFVSVVFETFFRDPMEMSRKRKTTLFSGDNRSGISTISTSSKTESQVGPSKFSGVSNSGNGKAD